MCGESILSQFCLYLGQLCLHSTLGQFYPYATLGQFCLYATLGQFCLYSTFTFYFYHLSLKINGTSVSPLVLN